MKVTLGYIPDNLSEDNIVQIDKMSITYSQPADTCSNSDEEQFLTIETQNNGMGEDGIFFDIKIDTHWSVSDPEQLSDLVRDFQKRMELEITKEADIKTYERKKQE